MLASVILPGLISSAFFDADPMTVLKNFIASFGKQPIILLAEKVIVELSPPTAEFMMGRVPVGNSKEQPVYIFIIACMPTSGMPNLITAYASGEKVPVSEIALVDEFRNFKTDADCHAFARLIFMMHELLKQALASAEHYVELVYDIVRFLVTQVCSTNEAKPSLPKQCKGVGSETIYYASSSAQPPQIEHDVLDRTSVRSTLANEVTELGAKIEEELDHLRYLGALVEYGSADAEKKAKDAERGQIQVREIKEVYDDTEVKLKGFQKQHAQKKRSLEEFDQEDQAKRRKS